MDKPRNFRAALNGFNREDVVRYIEYMNTNHTAQINELNVELEFLRGKLAASQACTEPDPALQKRLADYREQVQILENRCDTLEKERDEALRNQVAAVPSTDLEERCVRLEAELAEALAGKRQAEADRDAALQNQTAQELEIYRRAERTERMARERADQVYHRVNGVLADATVKVDEAAAQIGQMSETVMAHLSRLQEAVSGSKQALDDASATMYAIRPESEEV